MSDPHPLSLLHLFHLFPPAFLYLPLELLVTLHLLLYPPMLPLVFPPLLFDLQQLTEDSCLPPPPSPIKGTSSPLRDGAGCLTAVASPITFSIYECSSRELWDDELARVLSLKLQPDKLTGTGRYRKGYCYTLFHYWCINCSGFEHQSHFDRG